MPTADDVKKFRKKYNLTQPQLAKILGYKTDRTIQYIEAGKWQLRDEVWNLLVESFAKNDKK